MPRPSRSRPSSRGPRALSFLLGAVLILTACGGSGGAPPTAPPNLTPPVVIPPTPAPVGLTVVFPTDSVVTVGGTLVAVAGRTDGTLVPTGTRVSWSSSRPDLVTVDSLGQVAALAEGSAAITARVGDQSASRTIDVRGFRALSVDDGGVCAVRADGRLFCWGGGGAAYALAGGARTPTQVQSPARFTSVSVGRTYACAIDDQSELYCWGTADHGQLGTGAEIATVATPTKVRWGTKYRAVAAGWFHACALTLDGGVDCWGTFGVPGRTPALAPVRLTSADVAGPFERLVSLTYYTVCAATAAGAVACWGEPAWAVRSPVAGASLTGNLAASGLAMCGPTAGGDAVCWNVVSQYPLSNPAPTVMRGVNAVGVFPSSDLVSWCALSADGAATCWGSNGTGVLGLGDVGADGNDAPPTAMGGTLRFRTLALGSYAGCGIATTGRVYCWGKAVGEQLGGATTADIARTPLPVPIP
jgi:alpha-tubulin suppressor-like RCC1 family protein